MFGRVLCSIFLGGVASSPGPVRLREVDAYGSWMAQWVVTVVSYNACSRYACTCVGTCILVVYAWHRSATRTGWIDPPTVTTFDYCLYSYWPCTAIVHVAPKIASNFCRYNYLRATQSAFVHCRTFEKSSSSCQFCAEDLQQNWPSNFC